MHEGFLDLYDKREQRFLAVDRMPFADRGISNNSSFARDTQRIAMPRYNEENRNVRIFEQIMKSIDPVIAQSIWNDERFIIVNFYETSRVAFGRNINQAFGRFRCNDNKWRKFNELPRSLIQPITYLEKSVGKSFGRQQLSKSLNTLNLFIKFQHNALQTVVSGKPSRCIDILKAVIGAAAANSHFVPHLVRST